MTQVRDSRAALDTLRAEHAARLAAQAEAVDRQRQMQMAAKLQAMRKKKHEYLQYQRQLALQRVQVTISFIRCCDAAKSVVSVKNKPEFGNFGYYFRTLFFSDVCFYKYT